MAKLVRGKVIKEKDYREAHDITVNPDRDGATFASNDAPWVGEEQRWRSGIVPPPHDEASQYLALVQRVNEEETRGLTMTMDELETVLSSMPPAPSTPSGSDKSVRRSASLRLLSYTFVAGVAMVLTWMMVGMKGGAASSESVDDTPAEKVVSAHAASLQPPVAASACDVVASGNGICDGAVESKGREASSEAGAVPSAVEETAAVATPESVTKRSEKRAKGYNSGSAQTSEEEDAARISVVALAEAMNAAAEEKADGSAEAKVEKNAAVEETKRAEKASEVEAVEEDAFARAAIGSMGAVLSMAKVERPERKTESAATVRFGAPGDEQASGPSKAAVDRTMASIAPEVKKCRRGVSGKVVLELQVAGNTGRVVSVKPIDQVEVGATAARCAARAVKLAKFPPFEKSRFTVTHAFDI